MSEIESSARPDAGAERTVLAERPQALLFPFSIRSNRYIELHKMLLAEIGYEPRPLSLHYLSRGGWRHLLRRRTLVTIHWLESRPFRASGRAVSITGWSTYAFYLLLMAAVPARSAYFVHNHAVHDLVGGWKRLSVVLTSLMGRAASLRVVHDPAACQAYRAVYLPHPLYWDAPDTTPPARRAPAAGSPRLSVLGSVRPYKRLEALLEHWPQGLPLLIAGRCAPDYEQALRAFIESRQLAASVQLECGFLDDAAFAARLDATDVLLLPHDPESMLVSGGFFEAFGRVPLIVARASPFMCSMAAQHPNVMVYQDSAGLGGVLDGIVKAWPGAAADSRSAAARAQFGWATCVRAYRNALVAGSDAPAS